MRNRRILFIVRSSESLYYMRSIVNSMLSRNFEAIFLFATDYDKTPAGQTKLKMVMDSFDRKDLKYDFAVKRKDFWAKSLYIIRELLDLRRFFLAKSKSSFYMNLARVRMFPISIKIGENKFFKAIIKLKIFEGFVKLLEKIEPVSKDISRHIATHNPDALFLSPTSLNRESFEYMKAAKWLGIKTVYFVPTWDNLTTKAYIHVCPDKFFVWNKEQEKEALVSHNVPKERIIITGAAIFDQLFEKRRSSPRELFCRNNSLDNLKPIVVYLGSSKKVAKDESWVVKRVRDDLDKSGLQDVQIIIRPHPGNVDIYQKLGLRNTVILPARSVAPHSKESVQLFYDTISHSLCALLGVNTSAAIDVIILGKQVVTIDTDEYRDTQRETTHFKELISSDVLKFSKLDEVGTLIREIISGADYKKIQREKFIRDFIRPRGLNRPAGEVVADELESFLS